MLSRVKAREKDGSVLSQMQSQESVLQPNAHAQPAQLATPHAFSEFAAAVRPFLPWVQSLLAASAGSWVAGKPIAVRVH